MELILKFGNLLTIYNMKKLILLSSMSHNGIRRMGTENCDSGD